MARTAPAAAPTFETALAELEQLTQKMEGGELALEDSLAAYKRGAELVKFCQQKLAAVEDQVKVLEGDLLKNYSANERESAG